MRTIVEVDAQHVDCRPAHLQDRVLDAASGHLVEEGRRQLTLGAKAAHTQRQVLLGLHSRTATPSMLSGQNGISQKDNRFVLLAFPDGGG